jgi:excisionase family DNA binding protein
VRFRERTTITVEEAGRALSVGRQTIYEAVRTGEVPAVRVGRRWVVPVAPLAKQLGLSSAELLTRLAEDDAA